MKVTIKDLARMSNFSESTISRALNDNPQIPLKTKEKIIKLARENNYTVNTHARSLAKSKSNRIGVIFPNNFYEFSRREFFSQLEKHLLLSSDKTDYDIHLLRSSSIEKIVGSKFVDGLIIANRDITKEELDILDRANIPYTFLAFKPHWLEDLKIPIFKTDNIGGGYEVAKLMHSKGAKKMLTFTSDNPEFTDYVERTEGFKKYLEENELQFSEKSIIRCNMTFEDGVEAVKNLTEKLKKYDGIFCQQDKVALGIISIAEKYGIDIPKKILLVGYDNTDLISYFTPKLTTIEQNYKEIVSRTLKYLISVIENSEYGCREHLSEITIVEGETTSSIG